MQSLMQSSLKDKKKAAVEIQFNWIFVLVAGGLILSFFITLSLRQKSASESRFGATLSRDIEAILNGASVAAGTINEVDIPETTLAHEDCKLGFRIGNLKPFYAGISFSPNMLKGKKLLTWTKEWSMPYRIANFLFVATPKVRYVLIGNSPLAREINSSLPKELNKELISLSQLADVKARRDDKTRFVLFGKLDSVAIDESFAREDAGVIALEPRQGSRIGTVYFYKPKSRLKSNLLEFEPSETTYYIGKESLFGAVFAENAAMYNCAMARAFQEMGILNEIYTEKISNLERYYATKSDPCASYYFSSSINILKNLASALVDFPPATIGKLEALEGSIALVANQNKGAQLYSCALIY